MNLKKNLKFIVGGLALAICTVVVIFAASPSHAQSDVPVEAATEVMSNESEMSSENCADTKDCSKECMENKDCKKTCAVECEVPC